MVGPLGTVKTATINSNGILNFPNRPNGAVIYNRNTTLQVEFTRKAIQNIIKNENYEKVCVLDFIPIYMSNFYGSRK